MNATLSGGVREGERLQQIVERLAVAPLVGSAIDTFATSEGPLRSLRRVDRKYVVAEGLLNAALASVEDDLVVLTVDGRRDQEYDTLYFDSPDLHSFHAARARRPQRSKVRVRSYDAATQSVLEVKRRGRDGVTTKERHLWTGTFDAASQQFLGLHLASSFSQPGQVEKFIDELEPTGRTLYARIALVHKDIVRITIDRNLTVGPPARLSHLLPGQFIVETKSLGAATEFDKLLWGLGARPSTISKYALAIAASRPEQPTNRWTRYTRQLRLLP
jgi:hypothetical protein